MEIDMEMDFETNCASMIHDIENQNVNIIRQLGPLESLYDYEVLNGSLILSRAFLVSCPKIYNLNLSLVELACSHWIKRHPFLQSYVIRTGIDSSKVDLNAPKYYAFMDKEFSDYKNLEYLETKNPYEWRNIIENEIKKPFDYENGPLWRLKLIKVNDKFDLYNESEESNFSFILTSSHVIGDGRNLIKLMIELFDIINALLVGDTDSLMLEPPVVESKFSVEEMLAGKNLPIILDQQNDLNKKCVSIKTGNLRNLNQNFEYLVIRSATVNKLIKKSKELTKQAKLTSILTTILCFSMKKLYKKYGVNELDFKNLKYEVLASLRDKICISDSQMGIYSASVANYINFDELKLKNFWKIAEQQSITLHKKLNNNEDAFNVNCQEIAQELNDDEKNIATCYMYGFSNIGRINYKNDLPIKIKQHFLVQSLNDFSSSGVFFNSVSSAPNNDLCWTFNYIEKYYSNSCIKELKYLIVSFIESLISEHEE